VVGIGGAIDLVVLGCGSLPKHDTSKGVGVSVHVGGNQGLHLIGSKVVTLVGCSLTGRQTNIELGVLAGRRLDGGHPGVEVELSESGVDEALSRACSGVVVLNPDEVEGGVQDCVTELGIGDDALRSSREIEFAVRHLVEVLTEGVDHGSIAKTAVVLDVKVKAINNDIAKRTRTLPALNDWAKGSPQESGERDGTVLGEDALIWGIGTTDGQQDLLTSRLADGNILHDLMAAGQQLGYNAIISNVVGTVALVAEIGARPVSRAHIGEIVDESNIDDVQGGLFTEVAQTELVRTLTIVDGKVGPRGGIESRHQGSQGCNSRGDERKLAGHHVGEKKNDSGNKIPANYRTGKECRR
jgi:hypothetical protein